MATVKTKDGVLDGYDGARLAKNIVRGSRVAVTAGAGYDGSARGESLFVLDGAPYPLLVWWKSSPSRRASMLGYARRRWLLSTMGGLASLGSYGIALWAMTRAPVAVVSALRETSVLFGTALAVLVLKERFGAQRIAGTAVIVAGVIALRLS